MDGRALPVVDDDEWEGLAACLAPRHAGVAFFPERVDAEPVPEWRVSAAREVCATCPVRRQCLTDAYRSPHSTRYGVWGGTTGAQRVALLTTANRVDLLLEWFDTWVATHPRQMSLPAMVAEIQDWRLP